MKLPTHSRYVFSRPLSRSNVLGKVISLHAYAIAIEDGAFIGKIFSHIRDADRITEFLYAFEEKRYAGAHLPS